jgi:hypothetical protein
MVSTPLFGAVARYSVPRLNEGRWRKVTTSDHRALRTAGTLDI